MIQEVRQHLEALPFVPFSIVTNGGKTYRIPTADHAGISPGGNRVVIWFDEGGGVMVAALHITAIEQSSSPAT